jgi:hypothetical protein
VFRLAVSLLLAAALVSAGSTRAAIAEPVAGAAVEASPADRALTEARDAGERARIGDFAGAVLGFKRAHELDPRAEYACNIGIAYYKARDLPRAQFFLEGCLTGGGQLPVDFVASVKRVLTTVESRLHAGAFAPVEIRVSPPTARILASSFASDEPIASGRRIWLAVGRHLLLAAVRDHETRQIVVDLVGRDPQRVDIVLQPLPGAVAAVAAAPVPKPVPVAPAPAALAPTFQPPAPAASFQGDRAPRRSSARPFAIAMTISAVVGFAVSTAFYLAAEEAQNKADASTDPYGDPSAEFEADSYRYFAITGYVSTAVAASMAMILWSRVKAQSKPPVLGASGGNGGGAVWLGGRF